MLTIEEYDILERVLKYQGKDFDTCRLSNPCITKRETIYLANAIFKIYPEVYTILYKEEIKNGKM